MSSWGLACHSWATDWGYFVRVHVPRCRRRLPSCSLTAPSTETTAPPPLRQTSRSTVPPTHCIYQTFNGTSLKNILDQYQRELETENWKCFGCSALWHITNVFFPKYFHHLFLREDQLYWWKCVDLAKRHWYKECVMADFFKLMIN